MLSKSQFLQKHQAKFASLSKSERNRRYEQYRSSSRAGQRSGPTRSGPRPNADCCNSLMAPLICPSQGCSNDWVRFDATPILRTVQRYSYTCTADSNGYIACAFIPGFVGSVTNSVYAAPTIVAGAVTNWNTGNQGPGVITGLLKARALSTRIRVLDTRAPLNAGGLLLASIFMPDNNTLLWPINLTSHTAASQHMSGKLSEGLQVVLPPPQSSVALEWNDSSAAPPLSKYGATPSFAMMANGLTPGDTIQLEIQTCLEMTTGSGTNDAKQLLVPGTPVPEGKSLWDRVAGSFPDNLFSKAADSEFAQRMIRDVSATAAASVGSSAAVLLGGFRPSLPRRGRNALEL
jgi:hypothetical protein